MLSVEWSIQFRCLTVYFEGLTIFTSFERFRPEEDYGSPQPRGEQMNPDSLSNASAFLDCQQA